MFKDIANRDTRLGEGLGSAMPPSVRPPPALEVDEGVLTRLIFIFQLGVGGTPTLAGERVWRREDRLRWCNREEADVLLEG
jgi:hypothetical protein